VNCHDIENHMVSSGADDGAVEQHHCPIHEIDYFESCEHCDDFDREYREELAREVADELTDVLFDIARPE